MLSPRLLPRLANTRTLKVAIMVAHDLVMSMAACTVALLLRFSGNLPDWMWAASWLLLPYAFLSVAFYATFGLYRGIWRYTSTNELIRILQATALITLSALAAAALTIRLEGIPRSVFIIALFIQITAIAGPRMLFRLWRERQLARRCQNQKQQNILLIGANDRAEMFIREVNRSPHMRYRVVGMLDNAPENQGRHIHTVPVLGPLNAMTQVLQRLTRRGQPVELVVLTSREQATDNPLMTAARRAGLPVRRLPDLTALADGERVTNLRPVNIEDLLGRDPVVLNKKAIKGLVQDKVILITGAGGSIGSELCRQAAIYGASKLLLVENGEHALYQIDMELAQTCPELARHSLLADVTDAGAMNEIMQLFKPDVIFHAAAFKHVPLVEANPAAGIQNNLFGTMTVANAAAQNRVETMVIISTDKAVNPTNVMGATKRAAEIYCQNHAGPTNYITVRFGNVLGSTGSVVPLFQRQIAEGGPVTVTDKRVTRYFMTIPEAVQLTMQAAAMGEGGEIFVLDMGAPVNIYEMAQDMIRLSGLVPHVDIAIREIGLRPGEKLYEELLHDREELKPTEQSAILLAASRHAEPIKLEAQLSALRQACASGDAFAAVATLRQLVGDEYQPASNSPYAYLTTPEKRPASVS